MKQTAIQRLDAIILQFTHDDEMLDRQIEDMAEYKRLRKIAELIDSRLNPGEDPKSEAEFKKMYLLLTDDDKAIMERVAKRLKKEGGSRQ